MPRGRPSLERSRAISDRILESASRLFQENGYEGASMEAIATAAGVGKQAIYARYQSKEDLFVRAYNHTISCISASLKREAGVEETPADALKLACRAMAMSMLDPSMVNLTRIAIAEAKRFPELSNMVREGSIAEFVAPLSDYVRMLQEKQTLPPGDPELMSRSILVACYTFPLLGALLGHNSLEDPVVREAYFEEMWPLATMRLLNKVKA